MLTSIAKTRSTFDKFGRPSLSDLEGHALVMEGLLAIGGLGLVLPPARLEWGIGPSSVYFSSTRPVEWKGSAVIWSLGAQTCRMYCVLGQSKPIFNDSTALLGHRSQHLTTVQHFGAIEAKL